MSPAKFSKIGHHPDYFLLVLVVTLAIVGLVILASASSDLGRSKFDDSYYYLKHQLTNGVALGAFGFLVGYFFHYQRYRKLAFIILLMNLVLLVMVFVPSFGVTAGGASRWIRLGPMSFQPAELLKLTYIIYLAAWLTNPKLNRGKDVAQGLVPFLIISGIIGLLLIAQPATSTVAILILTGLVVYFMSGAEWKHIGLIVGAGALGLGVLLFASYTGWISNYRWQRIETFLHPASDTQKSGYQINQALIAIGSGQLTGVGYGQSTSKVNRLPAPVDDSIFAVAAQELGFVGSAGLVTLFGLLVFRMLWIANRLRDRFGTLILVGFGTIIAFQSIVNMAAISGLIPLTGVPLPFISYGGTALAVFLTMSGVSLNVSKYS